MRRDRDHERCALPGHERRIPRRQVDRKVGDGDVEIGFAKEVYFLCVPTIGNRLKRGLFHLYPDRRTTNQSLSEARNIMNAGARKYSNRTDFNLLRKAKIVSLSISEHSKS